MRVLHLMASVDPATGGPVEAVRMIGSQMSKSGHVSEVATLDDPGAPFVAEFPLETYALGPGLGRYGYSPAFTNWVARHAADYDAAVIHGLWNHAAVGGWTGLTRERTPYVIYAHGMMDPWFRLTYPLKHWAKQLYWWTLQGRVLRDARAVLFTSEEECRLARSVFAGPGYEERVVAFGTADAPPARAMQAAAFRAAVPRLADRPYLLFLGRIHPKKGCDLLIKAFGSVSGRWPGLDLVIAGPDEVGLRAGLEQQAARAGIAGRVHWPGMLRGDAKWGALRGAEALVLPSHQENFGLVVAEAMACGTPVLISNRVNIWREVEGSGGGLVADDTVAGSAAMLDRHVSMSRHERDAMGRRARAGYERHFTVAAAAQDLADVLASAADRRVVHEPA